MKSFNEEYHRGLADGMKRAKTYAEQLFFTLQDLQDEDLPNFSYALNLMRKDNFLDPEGEWIDD